MSWTEEDYKKLLKRRSKAQKQPLASKLTKEDIKTSYRGNQTQKTTKYHSRKVEKYNRTWDSQKELCEYERLLLLQKAGEITSITCQPVIELQPHFKYGAKMERAIKYIPDFLVVYADGRKEFIDVKASRDFKTEVYRIKRKLLLYKYPNIVFREVY